MSDWWDALDKARKRNGSGEALLFDTLTNWYESKLEKKHGAERYRWEQVPFLSWNHKLRAGAQKAEDEYNRTGQDDYYGDRYIGALDSFVNQIGGAVGKARRMAKTLDGMYPAEVEEDLSYDTSWEKWSKYDPVTQRMHEYGLSRKIRHKR